MKQARVLFDEFHSEAWSVRPEVARRMQPAHPEDSSYVRAARALAAHDFAVTPNTDRPLTDVLADADVLVHRPPIRPEVGVDHQRRLPPAVPRRARRVEEFVRAVTPVPRC